MKPKLEIMLPAFVIFVIIAIAIVLFFNQGTQMTTEKVELQKISDVPAICWEELAQKKKPQPFLTGAVIGLLVLFKNRHSRI